MSITDPPLRALSLSQKDQAEQETLGAEPFGGDLCGHQAWAFQPVDDAEPPDYRCVRCGAYSTRRFVWVKKTCRWAKSARRRRQIDAMLEAREPTHPHRPFFAARYLTLGGASWLTGKVVVKAGTAGLGSEGAGPPSLGDTL